MDPAAALGEAACDNGQSYQDPQVHNPTQSPTVPHSTSPDLIQCVPTENGEDDRLLDHTSGPVCSRKLAHRFSYYDRSCTNETTKIGTRIVTRRNTSLKGFVNKSQQVEK